MLKNTQDKKFQGSVGARSSSGIVLRSLLLLICVSTWLRQCEFCDSSSQIRNPVEFEDTKYSTDKAMSGKEVPVLSNIPLPPVLEVKSGNLATNWKRFRRIWDNYEVASRLKLQSNEQRTATLYSCIGADALEIADGLGIDKEPDIEVVLKTLETFCIGETNVIYERYCFNKRNQEANESIDSYVAALNSLAKSCDYGTLQDTLIRDRIVIGIHNNSVRKRLLQESKLTLKSCMDICRASEATAQQVKEMSQGVEEVQLAQGNSKKHSVKSSGTSDMSYKRKVRSTSSSASSKSTDSESILCKFCGKKHIKSKEKCPAWGRKCAKCGQLNHFAAKCRELREYKSKKKSVKLVDSYVTETFNDSSDSDSMLVMDTVASVSDSKYQSKLFTYLILNDNVFTKFQIDCGSTVNVIPRPNYERIFKDPNLEQVEPTDTTLVMFNKAQVSPLGQRTVQVKNPKNNKMYKVLFLIVEHGCRPVIGAVTCQLMKLITVNYENVQEETDNIQSLKHLDAVMSSEDVVPMTLNDVVDRYPELFTGEGLLPGTLHLEVDDQVPPVKLPVRKPPIALRDKFKSELERLCQLGVICRMTEPSEWISATVIVPKPNGKIRLCIDPKPLNKALKRNHYPLCTIEDVLPELAKARIFSVIDVKNGFWHVKLDNESSKLTTFATPCKTVVSLCSNENLVYISMNSSCNFLPLKLSGCSVSVF